MPRRSRHEKRFLDEQDTIGAQRAERRELEETSGRMTIESEVTRTQRLMRLEERDGEKKDVPQRVARAGKPLKRPR